MIDDGWQINRTTQPHYYIGGPFDRCNEKFRDMQSLAQSIAQKHVRPGIWFRPLLTLGTLPEEAKLRTYANGMVMDPSHPYTLERVQRDAARLRSWGYEIIKHDFQATMRSVKTHFRRRRIPQFWYPTASASMTTQRRPQRF